MDKIEHLKYFFSINRPCYGLDLFRARKRFCGFGCPMECLECTVINQHKHSSLGKEKKSQFASCLHCPTYYIIIFETLC